MSAPHTSNPAAIDALGSLIFNELYIAAEGILSETTSNGGLTSVKRVIGERLLSGIH